MNPSVNRGSYRGVLISWPGGVKPPLADSAACVPAQCSLLAHVSRAGFNYQKCLYPAESKGRAVAGRRVTSRRAAAWRWQGRCPPVPHGVGAPGDTGMCLSHGPGSNSSFHRFWGVWVWDIGCFCHWGKTRPGQGAGSFRSWVSVHRCSSHQSPPCPCWTRMSSGPVQVAELLAEFLPSLPEFLLQEITAKHRQPHAG